MNNLMENLIVHKFYKTKEEIIKKLTLFTAYNVISDEDFKKLMKLTEEKYAVDTIQ